MTTWANGGRISNRLVLTALQIFIFVALTSYQLLQLSDLDSAKYRVSRYKTDEGPELPCPAAKTKKIVLQDGPIPEKSFGACLIVMDDVSSQLKDIRLSNQ